MNDIETRKVSSYVEESSNESKLLTTKVKSVRAISAIEENSTNPTLAAASPRVELKRLLVDESRSQSEHAHVVLELVKETTRQDPDEPPRIELSQVGVKDF